MTIDDVMETDIPHLLYYGVYCHSPDVTFGWKESSYSFSEGDGIVEVSTVITDVPEEGLGSDITLLLTAIEGINAGIYLYIP